MEAIVLAGGFGSRLRSLVSDVPKPMAPVSGRPFLALLLSFLARKGFSRIVLSLGYMAETISAYFGPSFAGMEITYVVEETPLGTGGAIRLALDACTHDHIYIFNGDTYLDLDIASVEERWNATGNIIVVGRHVTDTMRYGRISTHSGRIIRFAEKGIKGPGLINAGCYVLASDSLVQFPLSHPFSFENDFLATKIYSSTVEFYESSGIFVDIGIPDDYLKSQTLLSDL